MLMTLGHVLGLDNASGHWYLFWSGFCGDLAYLSVVGGMIAVLRRHNCHEKRCWRIGKHIHEGTPWCAKHHPVGVVTRDDLAG